MILGAMPVNESLARHEFRPWNGPGFGPHPGKLLWSCLVSFWCEIAPGPVLGAGSAPGDGGLSELLWSCLVRRKGVPVQLFEEAGLVVLRLFCIPGA
jgi:hypothetical protein